MKYILIIFFNICCFISNSQEIVTNEFKASEMYPKMKEWVALNFKSANSVIQVDLPNEKLVIKGIKKEVLYSKFNNKSIPTDWSFDLLITIDFKDNKYRFNVETITSEEIWDMNEDDANKYVDSVVKNTPGGGLIGKKIKDDMKLNIISINQQKKEKLKTEKDKIIQSIKSTISKKDEW